MIRCPTDAITGTTCHWNVFRVCNTTQMEANAVTPTLIKDFGKKWYYITPDYVHVMQGGQIVKTGGKELALELESRGYDWVREASAAGMTA